MFSQVQQGSKVTFPEFTGERIYMQEFNQGDNLGRWTNTVEQMLDGIKTDGKIYLMVDQRKTQIGNTHRRPGVHIDGHWIPAIQAHHHHNPRMEYHRVPQHSHRLPHDGPRHGMPPRHFSPVNGDELIILASDVLGCQVYEGEYFDHFGEDGDMSHVDISGMNKILMQPNQAWIGDVYMLHQSIPHDVEINRTVVRLNVKVH